MNTAEAQSIARSPSFGAWDYRRAAEVLADEVDRLRGELLKANADTERLEGELAEARRQA